ncbi:1409_t:CDS:2 [Funneliformis geosporum]|nr:1409_t:CDS:2 [Funneliformis geosporum]
MFKQIVLQKLPKRYSVQSVDSYSFCFDLSFEQPILNLKSEMSLVLTSNFMQNLQTQQNNKKHLIIKIFEREDGLHGRDGGLLGIVSYLSSFYNVIFRSTLKRKHMDEYVGSISIILIEEKVDK